MLNFNLIMHVIYLSQSLLFDVFHVKIYFLELINHKSNLKSQFVFKCHYISWFIKRGKSNFIIIVFYLTFSAQHTCPLNHLKGSNRWQRIKWRKRTWVAINLIHRLSLINDICIWSSCDLPWLGFVLDHAVSVSNKPF